MANFFDQFDPPAPSVGPAPNAAPYSQSSPMAPAPAGAITPLFRQKQTESTSADADQARTQAEGAWDSLQQINNQKQVLSQTPDAVFGPIAGAQAGEHWFQPAPGRLFNQVVPDALYNPQGPNGTDLVNAYDRLNSGYNQLAFSKAKETLGRVNPEMFSKYVDTFGSPALTSRDAATTQLDDHAVNSWNVVAKGITTGGMNPYSGAYALSRPTGATQAQALGRGALFLAPDGSIQRNPQ